MNRSAGILAVAVVTVLGFEALPARGQGTQEPLTLRRAIEIALERSPLLKAAGHELEAAQASVERARAGFLPRVDFGESFTRSDNPVFAFSSKLNQGRFTQNDFAIDRLNAPGATNNFRTSLSLSQPLWTGGKATLGLLRARLGRDAAAAGLDRQRHEVIFAVARGYYAVQLARSELEVARGAIGAAESNRDLARARFAAGLVVESDVLSAEVRLATLREQAITAEGRLALAGAALNDVMGRPLDAPVEIDEPLRERAERHRGLAEVEALALDRRPDLRRLRSEEEAQARAVDLARAEFLPTLNATGSYDVNRRDIVANGQNSWFVGVALQWNLFNGLADRARIAEARAALQRTRALRERAASAVRLEVKEAFLAVSTARERIAVARRAVAQAEASLRLVQDRYAAGLTTIVNLLQTESALTQARGNLTRALHDYNLAVAGLELAAGTIDQDAF